MKIYNYVYQTKNLTNGKTYIGVHSTNNLNDGYMGRGCYRGVKISKNSNIKGLTGAILKHGKDNFKTEILSFYDTVEEAYDEEEFIVDSKWIKNRDNYNIALGGAVSLNFDKTQEHKNKIGESNSLEYVVVNIKTKEIFFIKNLNKWSVEKGISKRDIQSPLHGIVLGYDRLYKNTWWACKKEDWEGEAKIRNKNFKHSGVYLTNPEGFKIKVDNLPNFCKNNNLTYNNILKVISGERVRHKNWTKWIRI